MHYNILAHFITKMTKVPFEDFCNCVHCPVGREWLTQLRKCLQLNKIPASTLCSLLQRAHHQISLGRHQP